MNKEDVINRFSLTKTQTNKIDKYVFEVAEFNKHTNLVGKSTLENFGKDILLTVFSYHFLFLKKNLKYLIWEQVEDYQAYYYQ